MGREAGWIAIYSGIAGGADVILIPEQPFDIQEIAETIKAATIVDAISALSWWRKGPNLPTALPRQSAGRQTNLATCGWAASAIHWPLQY